jgi:hypothetical protein
MGPGIVLDYLRIVCLLRCGVVVGPGIVLDYLWNSVI